jgi:NAD(P)H-hydrate epimerase
VLVLAGSPDMPGAAVLCACAAYRVGAGVVEVCAPPQVNEAVHYHLPEAVTSPRTAINWPAASVILLGPGLGTQSMDLLRQALAQAHCPLVLDADGLNMLAADTTLLDQRDAPCVITPHPLEMSRLSGLTVRQILDDPIAAACAFACKHRIHVLLKGARTVIAFPDGNAVVNTTGGAALAKAGTGDALAGIIAGLIAQGVSVGDAAAAGAYLHGKAGQRLPLHGALAREVIDALPSVVEKLTK